MQQGKYIHHNSRHWLPKTHPNQYPFSQAHFTGFMVHILLMMCSVDLKWC